MLFPGLPAGPAHIVSVGAGARTTDLLVRVRTADQDLDLMAGRTGGGGSEHLPVANGADEWSPA